MDFSKYQQLALRTSATVDMDTRTALGICALGLTGEAGEVADIIKKYLGHGHELNTEVIAKELGDVLWYLAVLTATVGYDLEDIAEMNIAKLKARYPEGFSTERSINRSNEDG